MAVSVVIIKPTKFCNAGCTYCSAPPDVNGAEQWTVDRFKKYFDVIQEGLAPNATVIWHGGEPMLMPPEFYREAHAYARSIKPHLRFTMQTNLLLYGKRWKGVFAEELKGAISTSFDPDERHREYKGSTELYTRIFMERLNWAIDDGFRPIIIGTYTEETMESAFKMYDWALAMGDRAPSLRMNYRYPAGRAALEGPAIGPITYGNALVRLFDRWVKDVPVFTLMPLNEMFRKTIGIGTSSCPWMKDCGGRFLEIEPNGDVYNCSEFADLGDDEFRFGNLDEHDLAHLMASPAAVAIRRRRYDVPEDCLTCPHFAQCEAGCARDSVLFGRGLGGKFFYCQSWKMVFKRMKEAIASGEADTLIRRYNLNPDVVRMQCGFPALETA